MEVSAERGEEPLQPEWVIVNYDLLAKHMDTLAGVAWAGLVFDEAHYLKNHTSVAASWRGNWLRRSVESRKPVPARCRRRRTPRLIPRFTS